MTRNGQRWRPNRLGRAVMVRRVRRLKIEDWGELSPPSDSEDWGDLTVADSFEDYQLLQGDNRRQVVVRMSGK